MGSKTKRVEVDSSCVVIGGSEVFIGCSAALEQSAWNKLIPMLEDAPDDVIKLNGLVAVRTVPGTGLSGTHRVRIIRDESGRAVEAVIRLISDEAEEGK